MSMTSAIDLVPGRKSFLTPTSAPASFSEQPSSDLSFPAFTPHQRRIPDAAISAGLRQMPALGLAAARHQHYGADIRGTKSNFGQCLPFAGSAPSNATSRRGSISTDGTYASSCSSVMSPAASFLSSLSDYSAPPPVDVVDEEGREVGNYVLGKVLGCGVFSVVRQAYTTCGMGSEISVVAVKIVKRKPDMDDEQSGSQVEREIDIWRQVRHERLVRLIEVVYLPQATFMVCDLCPGGNLLNYLLRTGHPGFPENEAARLWTQLCSGVQYLHEVLRVAHRDIKLENIFLTDAANVKLGDFGLADYVDRSTSSVSENTAEGTGGSYIGNSSAFDPTIPPTLGSVAYCAPEILRPDRKQLGMSEGKLRAMAAAMMLPAGDSWALGVILFSLVTGTLPFADDFEPRLVIKIMNLQYPWAPNFNPMPVTPSACSSFNEFFCHQDQRQAHAKSGQTPQTNHARAVSMSLPFTPSSTSASPPSSPRLSSSISISSVPTECSSVKSAQQGRQQKQLQQQLRASMPSLPHKRGLATVTSAGGWTQPRTRTSSFADQQAEARELGSPEVRALVAGLLTSNWRDRLSVREALQTDWVRRHGFLSEEPATPSCE